MGTAERKQFEKSKRRKLILENAAGIFHKKGFAGATMDAIAKKAQIAVGTIYLYFKSKSDIYFCLTQQALEDLSKRLKSIVGNKEASPDVKIRKLMFAVEEFYLQNKDVYALITRIEAKDGFPIFPEDSLKTLGDLMRSNLGQLEIVIDEGIRKGLYRRMDPYLRAVVFWSSLIGIIQFQENRMVQGKRNHRKATMNLFLENALAGLKK